MPVAAGTRADIVFLTALGLEHDAVRSHLTSPASHVDPEGTHYTFGELGDGRARVALALIGEGNLSAAVLTARAIQQFEPKALILVGVAGGVSDDVAIGDVVVATRIHTYQGGREESEAFRPRVKSWPAAHGLEQAARAVAQSGTWSAALPDGLDAAVPRVHFKPIVSGDVVLDSRTSPLARLIANHYGDAIAIDMESAGFAEAAHRHSFHRAISVRGISDAADGRKRPADASGSQGRAAANAAAFAVALAGRVAGTGAEHATPPDYRGGPAPVVTGASPPLANRRAGSVIRRHVRPAYLISAALVAAISLLVYLGTTTLLRDRSGTGATSDQDTAPTATPEPASTSGAAGWTVIRRGRDVELSLDQVIDLDTGGLSPVDQVATGPDLRLSREADRITVTPPGRMKVLDEPGPEDPERCAFASTQGWDGTKDGLWLLGRDRNICVVIGDGRGAMLTVVSPPNGTDPVLTFHYVLWERR